MRKRSTWTKTAAPTPGRQAATERRADIYTMNQEHPQPSPVDYENGNPDSWAETPVPGDKMSVNAEYEGDHVKRNSLNFGDFRDDTWKHKDSDKWHGPGKYDNAKVAAERKAVAAERVARAILRTSNEKMIEDTTLDLMSVPSNVLVATLKRMDQVSPDALPKEAKYRRAMACCKLSARLLGDTANEKQVEHVGSVFMGLDDPTLKAILSTVAAVRVAEQQEEQEEQGGYTGQQEQQGQQQGQQQQQSQQEQQGQQQQQGQQEQQSQQQQQGQQEEEEEEEEEMHAGQQQQEQGQQQQQTQQQQQQEQGQQQQQTQQQQQQEQQSQQQSYGHGLSAEDLACLDEMLHEEMAEGGAGGDQLQNLFAPPAAPAAGLPVPAAPMMASSTPDISFDDDDGEDAPVAAVASDSNLDALFNDHPEVMAQREIASAELEQRAREGGYTTAAVTGRTASTAKGAKKLGAVRASKGNNGDDMLASIWDRPQG